jgi:L-threonylcarbamoyladenylate synthase
MHEWKAELHDDRITDSGSMRIDVERRRPMTTVIGVDPAMPSQTDIARAADCLRRGGLVAFPTETVYGLGVHAMDRAAVRRLFEAKGRPANDPLIVHVSSFSEVAPLVAELPPHAERLASQFWPGALTLVLRRASSVPDEVTAGLETVAIRVPAHPVAHALLLAASLPIAAPSANLFSRTSPTLAAHVLEDLDGRIDMILDGGPTSVGVESTVLDLTVEPPLVLRPGAISIEMLRAIVPTVADAAALPHASGHEAMSSPGLLSKHYAPRAPLTIYRGASAAVALALRKDSLSAVDRGQRVGVLVSTEDALLLSDLTGVGGALVVLGTLASADDAEATASRLYAALRELDTAGVDVILARDIVNTHGLWRAVRDRLHRAAARVAVVGADTA